MLGLQPTMVPSCLQLQTRFLAHRAVQDLVFVIQPFSHIVTPLGLSLVTTDFGSTGSLRSKLKTTPFKTPQKNPSKLENITTVTREAITQDLHQTERTLRTTSFPTILEHAIHCGCMVETSTALQFTFSLRQQPLLTTP